MSFTHKNKDFNQSSKLDYFKEVANKIALNSFFIQKF
ncbi:hypothetical protein SAMN05444005_10166 [Flavobacterium urocaniciphilum]|uniref:Uncharacterized protein n=1 Tax=Flavobacterium urocaniciphilum TaxID=1299341 RepID=A0A1H8YS04_9FLAO|nr:hypothetical protein SAMN05444005_10166 [Flavobacterium urocaniciphilum]